MLLSINSKYPVIEMTFENYDVSLKFMLDMAAGPSMLKIGKKPSKAIFLRTRFLNLRELQKSRFINVGKHL